MAGDARIGSSSEPIFDSTTGPTRADQSTRWRIVRGMLIASWLTLMAIAVAVGERPSSYANLEGAVAAGQVRTVQLAGHLGPREHGFTVVEVHWHRGLFNYATNVIESRPHGRAPRHLSSYDATAVIHGNVGARLTALQPDLTVVRIPRTGSYATIWGWRLPSWVFDAAFMVWFGALVLLAGPRPWRATRWAWFWLILVTAPVGVPAFLFLSGPAPPLSSPGARRLTGGWAFLLAVVISSAANSYS